MKKSLFALTVALAFGMAAAQTEAPASAPQVPALTDVPAGHWAKDAIDRLVGQGIILGYPDGTYRGTQNLTRYEAAVIIARLLDQVRTGEVPAGSMDAETLTALQNAIQELAADLDRCSSDMTEPLAELVKDSSRSNSMQLIEELVATAKDMQATVLASHAELLGAQRSLAEIKAELIESRKLLGQDPLTGTENRRSMGMILEREVLHARSEGSSLSVAMVDVDHFKKINDIYGHAAGDAALVHLTAIARSILRGNDAFIRYGGEEFLLILPETGLAGASFVAERLQAILEKAPLVYEGKAIAMAFSAGVAQFKSDDTEETLVQRADAALYGAKRAGRRRVVASE